MVQRSERQHKIFMITFILFKLGGLNLCFISLTAIQIIKLHYMVSMKSIYLGGLRTEVEHLKSGNKVITDAPVDNNGKGEAFSPTDLTCASLNSCMMTLMGILAEREGINLTGLQGEIVKVMSADPRKIAEIKITFTHESLQATEVQKEKLKRAALSCPVALSLDPQLKQTIQFNF
jgi:putative redox protein